MAEKGEPRQRRIDSAAKAAFLAGLRDGLSREGAAMAAGFSLTGFYGARGRDPAFAADWAASLASASAADRRARAYAERGEVRIASANRRFLQRRRRAHVRFTAERREIYVACLAESCDSVAAAGAAGVHPATARLHRRRDPDFDSACRDALDEGYVRLEAEALRLRLAEQARLRAAIESAGAAPPARLLADQRAEFDRIMKLLARHDRKPNRPATRAEPGSRHAPWSFEKALTALDQALDAFARKTGKPRPPYEGEEGEGEGEGEGEDECEGEGADEGKDEGKGAGEGEGKGEA